MGRPTSHPQGLSQICSTHKTTAHRYSVQRVPLRIQLIRCSLKHNCYAMRTFWQIVIIARNCAA